MIWADGVVREEHVCVRTTLVEGAPRLVVAHVRSRQRCFSCCGGWKSAVNVVIRVLCSSLR